MIIKELPLSAFFIYELFSNVFTDHINSDLILGFIIDLFTTVGSNLTTD